MKQYISNFKLKKAISKRGSIAALVLLTAVFGLGSLFFASRANATGSTLTIAVIGDYGCDPTNSTCTLSTANESGVASLVHSWSPDAIWTVGDNSYTHGCVGSNSFTNATNHECAYPDPSYNNGSYGTVGSGSTNTSLIADTSSPTPADRWSNDWYTNETVTVMHSGVPHTAVVKNDTPPSPDHLYFDTGFSGGFVPSAGDTFTITPIDDITNDQSPYASDIAAGKFYTVTGNHDAENINNVVFGGSASNTGAYCPHQNDGSNYFTNNVNCGFLFNRPSHYTAGFGTDGSGHDLVDFFANDVRASDPDGMGSGSKQTTDYLNDLSNSTAVWKIEGQHESNWSSGLHGSFANTNQIFSWQNTNWTINSGIDLFLSGHDHDMEQIYGGNADNSVSGKTFMVMGTGGKSVETFTHLPCPLTGYTGYNDCNSTSGFPYTVWRDDQSTNFGSPEKSLGALKLTITTTQLKAQYIAMDGTVLHTYSLYKSGAGAAEVKGTVTDSITGNPIPNARISYADGDVFSQGSGSANGNGVYDFRDGIPANTTLTVTAPGYLSGTINVTSVPNTSANVSLHPEDIIFSDSFESNDLTKWTSHSTTAPTVCTTNTTPSCTPNVGSYATDFNSNNTSGGQQITENFTNTNANTWTRGYYNIRNLPANANLFTIRTGSGGSMWHAYLDYNSGEVGVRNDATSTTYPGCDRALSTSYPWSGGYHKITSWTHTDTSNASNDYVKILIDGNLETMAGPDGTCGTGDDATQLYTNIGTTLPGRYIAGDSSSTKTFEYWLDDTGVDNNALNNAWGKITGNVASRVPEDCTNNCSPQGISGATVSLAYTSKNWGTPPSATTDSSGNFTINNVISDQNVIVSISAPNYATQTFTDFVQDNDGAGDYTVTQNAVLGPQEGIVTGNVKDATTNANISGVLITGDEGLNTSTDSSGNYTVADDPGLETFTVTSSGYASSSAQVNIPSGGGTVTQDYTLSPNPGTVSGTVTDATTGSPISGVNVSYSGGSTTTDSSGNYSFSNVTAETSYTITASKSNYANGTNTMNLSPGGTATKNITMSPNAGSFSGTVTDAVTSAALSGVTVSYSGGSTTTDSSGNYSFSSVPAETSYTITASLANYTNGTNSVNLSPGGSATKNISMTATAGTVTGNVKDATTNANLSGVNVSYSGGSTTTDSSGNYTLSNVPAEISYTITASLSNYGNGTTSVNLSPAGSSTQNFTLTPNTGTVSGYVYQTDGVTGINGATVSYSGGSTTTDIFGHYSISSVPAETSYTFTASATGYANSNTTANLSPGGSSNKNFTLGQVLFSDNFESGGFSNWTTNTNSSACTSSLSGCPHAGTYGDDSTASGSTAAYLKKTLSSTASEVYFRSYVYIRSQGSNNVTLLQLANSSGSLIAHVFINSSHQLGIRDDFALTTNQSTTAISTGAWHSVEFHVKINGTSSTTDVYLDGTAIGSLSSTSASLGTNNVAAVWLGENQTSRTYDVVYDDAVVQNAYVGP